MTTNKNKPRPFRPSDKMARLIGFARWCARHGVEPFDAAELVALAQKAKRAGENHCNLGDRNGGKYERANDRAQERFEEKAKAMGFGVQWPGLWPTLQRDGQNVYLPTVD